MLILHVLPFCERIQGCSQQLLDSVETAGQVWLCRYVFSADVARALHEVNAIAPLKFMPNEDATFGFWVMGMDLRHVDQPM